MLSIGRMNRLVVDRIGDEGGWLVSDAGEVLLPTRLLQEGVQAGDSVTVFVYTDDRGRLLATTIKPHAMLGDMAVLEVVDVTDHGAFLAWGMEKDLLLPYRRQVKPVVIGRKCVVKVLLDEDSGRVIATTRLRPFLQRGDASLETGQEVTALFFDESENGFSAIVNGRYLALLHRPEATEIVGICDTRSAYIKRLLPQGQIELCLRKVGYEAVVENRPQLIAALEAAGGFLPYTDKSSPEAIRQQFGMSKKAFKKSIGALYKEKKIRLAADGIHLV